MIVEKDNLQSFSKFALDSVSSKLLIVSKDLKVTYLNKAAEDFLNISLEDAKGKIYLRFFTKSLKMILSFKNCLKIRNI